jgi:superfamily II DNA or RNA helicase
MQRVALPDLDLAVLKYVVGGTTYERGAAYARQGAVGEVWWEEPTQLLGGFVRGSGGRSYATQVSFAAAGDGRLEFQSGQCSCPMAFNCKHTVALVLATLVLARQSTKARLTSPAAEEVSSPPAWQRSIESLLKTGRGADAAGRASTALAVELTMNWVAPSSSRYYEYREPRNGPQQVRLYARLVQRGKNGGWIAGNLGWNRLESLRYQGEHRADHVRLLSELYSTFRSSQDPGSFYSHGGDRVIDLAHFESRQLWPMLDEAAAVGIRLVYPQKLGDLPGYDRAEFSLDLTRPEDDGPLLIRPALRVENLEAPVTLLGFIGSAGHGVIYAQLERPDGSELGGLDLSQFDLTRSTFRLARLTGLTGVVPGELQRLALEGQRLEIPAAELSGFRDTYYLRLRQLAATTSSDGSFAPPEVKGPTLLVRAHYYGGHDVETTWEWQYQIGEEKQSFAATPGPDEDELFRDRDAELAILADLDAQLHNFGSLRFALPIAGAEQTQPRTTRLSGLDTMRFTTELLPLLADRPGIAIEVTGSPADYREVGDSLKIALSVDELPAETDWFDLGITITVEGKQIPFIDVFTALARKEPFLLLADGAFFSLEKPELQALARLIEEARGLQDISSDPLRISRYQAGLWDELTEHGVVERQAAAWEKQVRGLLSATAVQSEPPPATLQATLRPYQLDGYSWLRFCWEHKLGGILADDMGLGKTLQSLALLTHARQAEPESPPFLIVAPTSVVPNWAAECARFAPSLKVVSLTETTARRGQPMDQATSGADAVITSYALLRIDFDHYARLPWSALILDEAQNTKNHQSKIYQCARKLPASFKLAITGTPMENNLMELWSLLSIAAPGLFPHPQRFRDYYAKPIENHGTDHAELLGQLRRRIRPLMLRRTKEQVAADLPAKQEQVLEVELNPKHRKIYQTHLQRERQKVLRLIDDLDENRFTILRSLTLLRQLSLHAGLVDDDEHHDVPSAKIDALVEHLRDLAGSGHRALVFSQFTGFLAKVKHRLGLEGIEYCYLDGSTRNRAAELRRFKEGDAPAFLISLKAGGFGLNLTEADYCFLLDPWWNPATEAQAVDRTHRIGQTRNVMVYRLIASDTIEEKVMALKARKADLFASVLDEGNVFGSSLSANDIRELFA